jgi:hypothetical protein
MHQSVRRFPFSPIADNENIWLHIMDHDIIQLFRWNHIYSSSYLRHNFMRTTRIACLFTRSLVLIPAAIFFETDFGDDSLTNHLPFADLGILKITGSAIHSYDFFEKRSTLFAAQPFRAEKISKVSDAKLKRLSRYWIQKPSGTTAILIDGWDREACRENGIWNKAFERCGLPLDTQSRDILRGIPNRLNGGAFSAELAMDVCKWPTAAPLINAANLILSKDWVLANMRLLKATIMMDIPGLLTTPLTPQCTNGIHIQPILQQLHVLGILEPLWSLPPESIFQVAMNPKWQRFASVLYDCSNAATNSPHFRYHLMQAAIETRDLVDRTHATAGTLAANGICDIAQTFVEKLPDIRHPNGLSHSGSPFLSGRTRFKRRTSIKIFISHATADSAIARKLIEVLLLYFDLRDSDIRCTSVPGFKLSTGARQSDVLRSEILASSAIIGLISRRSVSSPYVLFELGAAWAVDRPVFPVVSSDFDFGDLPGPLKERHASRLSETTEIYQLLENMADLSKLPMAAFNAAHLADKINTLARTRSR